MWKHFLIYFQALLSVHSLELIILAFRKVFIHSIPLIIFFPHTETSNKIDCHTGLD